MNKMHIFYDNTDNSSDSDEYKFTEFNRPNIDKTSQQIELYPFPIKYHKMDIEYEFALLKKGNSFFLSDQGKTLKMLDKVFELKEEDVKKNLNAIMRECRVLRSDDEFLIEINSPEDSAKINEANYRLLECVSFMDTMRIFYV